MPVLHLLLLVGTFVIFGVLFHFGLLRRALKKHLTEKHTDFVAAASQNIGTLYGILLAFIVVVSWQNYTDVQNNIQHEASFVQIIQRTALAFDQPVQTQIRQDMMHYLQSVQDLEWPAMRKGQIYINNPAYLHLWHTFTHLTPHTPTQTLSLQVSLELMKELAEARNARILASEPSLSQGLWVLLIIGAVCIMIIVLLAETIVIWLRYLVLFLELVLIMISFSLIDGFDRPYMGIVALDATSYQASEALLIHSAAQVPYNDTGSH